MAHPSPLQVTSPESETFSPLDSRTSGLALPLPPQQALKDETIKPTTNVETFFFVLSASSPLTPLTSENVFKSISPDIAGDIPEPLAQLLPQPSTSLLGVIEGAASGVPSDDQGPSAAPTEALSRSHPGPPKSSHPHLHDNTASSSTSQVVTEPFNLPTSPVAEVALIPPSPSLEPLAQCRLYCDLSTTHLGNRPRATQSMDMSPRQPPTTREHARGLSSPFPLPIQFTFAPPSVKGSAATPYSYF